MNCLQLLSLTMHFKESRAVISYAISAYIDSGPIGRVPVVWCSEYLPRQLCKNLRRQLFGGNVFYRIFDFDVFTWCGYLFAILVYWIVV